MEENLDAWVEELGAVLSAPDLPRLQRVEPGADKKWKAGDIASRIPKSQLETVADKVGVPVGQLRSYAEVARAYPADERTVRAAWTVYREVRIVPPDQRREILRDGLTLRQARLALGKGPVDRPKKERLSDEERAWFVIEELQEPGVRLIVEKEMKESAVARQARRAARSAVNEIDQERKRIDAELKKLAKEGTPQRQYLEASKQLIDAERYIYSVVRLFDRHTEAMSAEHWHDLATRLRNVATSALDVASRLEGPTTDDLIEGEVVPDFLELGSGPLGAAVHHDAEVGEADDDIVDGEIVGD